uniref:Uncharacterized protein n=1 Tax=Oryza glaberrima TaxID=4538 RepID=I1QS90_ORYGL
MAPIMYSAWTRPQREHGHSDECARFHAWRSSWTRCSERIEKRPAARNLAPSPSPAEKSPAPSPSSAPSLRLAEQLRRGEVRWKQHLRVRQHLRQDQCYLHLRIWHHLHGFASVSASGVGERECERRAAGAASVVRLKNRNEVSGRNERRDGGSERDESGAGEHDESGGGGECDESSGGERDKSAAGERDASGSGGEVERRAACLHATLKELNEASAGVLRINCGSGYRIDEGNSVHIACCGSERRLNRKRGYG